METKVVVGVGVGVVGRSLGLLKITYYLLLY